METTPLSRLSSTNEKGRQWPQFIAVISASLLAIGTGFQLGWPSPSILKLLSGDLGFKVTEDEVSYIVMIAPLGYTIGSPLCGFTLDKLGRKCTLLLLSIPQIIPWLLIATSRSVPMLYLSRLITGIADGALFTALPIYMCEILEPKIRGVGGTTFSLGLVIGVLLINCYGSYLSIKSAAFISLSAPILFILTFMWMPESPYYLLMNKCWEKAKRSLMFLRRMQNVDEELSRIYLDVQRQISEPGKLRDVFTIDTNLKAFLIIFSLRTIQQLSGLPALCFYAQVIFDEVGEGLSPAQASIICFGIQAVVTAFSSVLMDKVGRRPLTICSSAGCAIVLFTIGFYFAFKEYGYNVTYVRWLPVTGMVLFYVISSIGLLMVPNLMAGELLSASVKSKALGIINIYFGLCMSAVSKMFQWLDSDFGMKMPFFIFGLCCIAGTVFCYECVPETKGKRLEEIQQILKSKNLTKREISDTGV